MGRRNIFEKVWERGEREDEQEGATVEAGLRNVNARCGSIRDELAAELEALQPLLLPQAKSGALTVIRCLPTTNRCT